jgi:hypothetical protein
VKLLLLKDADPASFFFCGLGKWDLGEMED